MVVVVMVVEAEGAVKCSWMQCGVVRRGNAYRSPLFALVVFSNGACSAWLLLVRMRVFVYGGQR